MFAGKRWTWGVVGAAVIALAGGCDVFKKSLPADSQQQVFFGPATMRLHPIFTQVANWTQGTRPNGIQAELEFQDQFGDPTKAAGTVYFDLYHYRKAEADPRGEWMAHWNGSLLSVEEQIARWNKASRTYSFQLIYDKISPSANYVLDAVFETTDGQRFFGHMIIEGQKPPDHSGLYQIPATQNGGGATTRRSRAAAIEPAATEPAATEPAATEP